MQNINATIIDVDFLPSNGFDDSIFIIWAKPDKGADLIVETLGSKKKLIRKFKFKYGGRENWDLSMVIKKRCEIQVNENTAAFISF